MPVTTRERKSETAIDPTRDLSKVDLSGPDPLLSEALRLSHLMGGGHYSWYLIDARMNLNAARDKAQSKNA